MNNEFEKYAKQHLGLHDKMISGYQSIRAEVPMIPQASVTPTIIEERKLNVAAMSVFDRLMMDRILWVAGAVDDRMSIIVQAQLLFLSDQDPNKMITMHIDSPGGSVKAGLSMVDSMELCKADIQTVNTGMAASMGSVLLGAGTKGMRSSLRHSRTMLHQSSGGVQGNIQDGEIQWNEWKKINKELFVLLGEYSGKGWEEVANDASRDLWLNAEEAIEYGIIDEVVRPTKS
jgi:ATP-dependent Clp protease protease subunit